VHIIVRFYSTGGKNERKIISRALAITQEVQTISSFNKISQ